MDELKNYLLQHNQFIEKDGQIYELDSPGCQFEEEQLLQNVTVQILRCKKCGKYSIAWGRQPNTIEVPGGITELERQRRELEEYGEEDC